MVLLYIRIQPMRYVTQAKGSTPRHAATVANDRSHVAYMQVKSHDKQQIDSRIGDILAEIRQSQGSHRRSW